MRLVSRYHQTVIELAAPVDLDEINEHDARALATAVLHSLNTKGVDDANAAQL